jgi:hypothetical protein
MPIAQALQGAMYHVPIQMSNVFSDFCEKIRYNYREIISNQMARISCRLICKYNTEVGNENKNEYIQENSGFDGDFTYWANCSDTIVWAQFWRFWGFGGGCCHNR